VHTPLRIPDGFPGERLTILPLPVMQRALRLPVCRDLCVTHTGRFDHVQGHYVDRPHGRPEYVFIFCLSGQGRVQIGRSTYHLHSGRGVVLPPRRAHRYAAEANAPWTICWFHFVGRRARDYAEALGLRKNRPHFWVQDSEVIAEAFEDCYRHVTGGYTDGELLALSTSFARLLGLCRVLQRSVNRRRRHTEERLLHVLRFMRLNLQRPVTLAALAREASLSVPHFSAVFRHQMKCSPVEFFIRLKMQRASELLLTTTLTASEIAGRVGYQDPLYFSRVFRQKTGVSPRPFRRNIEGNNNSLR
jgi:AraC family transcriptional regulator of arabinose operon